MRLKPVLVAGLALLASQPVLAACPPPPAGSTAEEIKAHGERIVCFQRELSQDAERRKLQMEMDAMNRRLQELQLQRQFDLLPQPQPLTPPLFQ